MTVLSIILQVILIVVFLLAGGSKIAGSKMQKDSFRHLGLPQWFRVVTGLVQYIGVAALLIGFQYPGIAAWAGIWLCITMILAGFAHLRVGDPAGRAVPACALAILSVLLVIANVDGLSHPFF